MNPRSRNRGSRPLKRRVATRRPKKTLVVFCEGERTEPEYLDSLKRLHEVRQIAAVDIRIEAGQGRAVPRTLVAKAIEAHNRAVAEGAEIDEFWCVFDVEWPRNHPGLMDALRQAQANGINLAMSNPCFELWLILHFQDHAGWLDNAGACRLRARLDGAVDKGLDTSKYMPLIADAAHRAEVLEARHLRDNTEFPHDNPSSGMHRLIASVMPPSS